MTISSTMSTKPPASLAVVSEPENVVNSNKVELSVDLNIPLGINISKAESGPVYVSSVNIDSQLANRVFPGDIILKLMDCHVTTLTMMRELLSRKPPRHQLLSGQPHKNQATLVVLRKQNAQMAHTKEAKDFEQPRSGLPPKKRRVTIREITRAPVPRHSHRRPVKDAIVTAFDLHKASETLTKFLEEQTNESSKQILKEELLHNIASMKFERDNILKIDKSCYLTLWEHRLRQHVLNVVCPEKHTLPKKHPIWATGQRKLRHEFVVKGTIPSDTTEEMLKYNIEVLDRVGFTWEFRKQRTWEDYFDDLKEFHTQNGHCRIPQVHPQLGEWAKRMRKQYANYQRRQEEAANGSLITPFRKARGHVLTSERIEAMNKLGFVWKIRAHRQGKNEDEILHKNNTESRAETNKHLGSSSSPASPAIDTQ